MITLRRLKIRVELHLFPQTRFAYLYLMMQSLQKNISVVRMLAESPVYKLCKEQAKKRGGVEGKTALSKFELFESIIETRTFKVKLALGAEVLMPLSMALHYLEGDSIPMSHVYPVFQAIYSYVQGLEDELTVSELLDGEDINNMIKLVRDRWEGVTRKKGLKQDIHLAAFTLDPYAQAAVSTPKEPTTELLNSATLTSARAALRQYVSDPAQRALLSDQLTLYTAAHPACPEGKAIAEAQGDNGYSGLVLATFLLVWDKVEAREQELANGPGRAVDKDGIGYEMVELIHRLKLCSMPTTFWLAMSKETPVNVAKKKVEAHICFCKVAVDLSGVVGHTCGVERAGKAYKLVMTAHRKAMCPQVAKKAVYVLNNYGLLNKSLNVGAGLEDFAGSMLVDEHVAEELQAKRLHFLRRGKLITDEELMVDEVEQAEAAAAQGEAVPHTNPNLTLTLTLTLLLNL